jgi:hypothetical protein
MVARADVVEDGRKGSNIGKKVKRNKSVRHELSR